MGIFTLITNRNKIRATNQEFKVRGCDDFNDNKIRNYSQEPKKMFEYDIIQEIEKGGDFRTKNTDGTYTKCEVNERNGLKYLTSKPNNSTVDNITNLLTY